MPPHRPPRRWHLSGAPTSVQLAEIAASLKSGGVLLLPTDTIYGLHVVAAAAAAVGRLSEIKGRDETKPFIVLAADASQVRSLGLRVDAGRLDALADIWPAPLTVVLPLERPVPASRGASTLAVRIPDLEWLRALVSMSGPLVSTSANRSGEPAVHDPGELARDLRKTLEGIVDAGRLDGKPSAILDLTGDELRFLREGDPSFTQSVRKSLWKSR